MRVLNSKFLVILVSAVFTFSGCSGRSLARETDTLLDTKYAGQYKEVEAAMNWHQALLDEQEKQISEDKTGLDKAIGMSIAQSMQSGIYNAQTHVLQLKRELTFKIIGDLQEKGLVGEDKADVDAAAQVVLDRIDLRLK